MNYKFSLKAKEKEILEDFSSLLTTELFFICLWPTLHFVLTANAGVEGLNGGCWLPPLQRGLMGTAQSRCGPSARSWDKHNFFDSSTKSFWYSSPRGTSAVHKAWS